MRTLKKTGEMHENYNADTGEALVAPGFVSWNLLANNMLEDVLSKKDPFQLIRSSLFNKKKIFTHSL